MARQAVGSEESGFNRASKFGFLHVAYLAAGGACPVPGAPGVDDGPTVCLGRPCG
jgi:hypothetical protein